jgi:hypothetical protein
MSAALIYQAHTIDSLLLSSMSMRGHYLQGGVRALSQPHVWILPRLRILLAKIFGAEEALSGNFGPA